MKYKHKHKSETRKLWAVFDIPTSMIVVLVSWVFAYVRTHQMVHVEYIQFSVYQLYHNKTVKTNVT